MTFSIWLNIFIAIISCITLAWNRKKDFKETITNISSIDDHIDKIYNFDSFYNKKIESYLTSIDKTLGYGQFKEKTSNNIIRDFIYCLTSLYFITLIITGLITTINLYTLEALDQQSFFKAIFVLTLFLLIPICFLFAKSVFNKKKTCVKTQLLSCFIYSSCTFLIFNHRSDNISSIQNILFIIMLLTNLLIFASKSKKKNNSEFYIFNSLEGAGKKISEKITILGAAFLASTALISVMIVPLGLKPNALLLTWFAMLFASLILSFFLIKHIQDKSLYNIKKIEDYPLKYRTLVTLVIYTYKNSSGFCISLILAMVASTSILSLPDLFQVENNSSLLLKASSAISIILSCSIFFAGATSLAGAGSTIFFIGVIYILSYISGIGDGISTISIKNENIVNLLMYWVIIPLLTSLSMTLTWFISRHLIKRVCSDLSNEKNFLINISKTISFLIIDILFATFLILAIFFIADKTPELIPSFFILNDAPLISNIQNLNKYEIDPLLLSIVFFSYLPTLAHALCLSLSSLEMIKMKSRKIALIDKLTLLKHDIEDTSKDKSPHKMSLISKVKIEEIAWNITTLDHVTLLYIGSIISTLLMISFINFELFILQSVIALIK